MKLVNLLGSIRASLMMMGSNSLLVHLLKGSNLMEKLQKMMVQGPSVLLLYVDVVNFQQVAQLHGDALANRVLHVLRAALRQRASQFMDCLGDLVVENLWGDDFLVLCRYKTTSPEHLTKMSTALRLALEESLKAELFKLTGSTVKLHVGYATIAKSRAKKAEYALYTALRDAQKVAKGALNQQTLHLREEFEGLLEKRDFLIVYQPIASLQTGEILGWEALTRGPRGSYFETPMVIFNFAEEVGLLFPLEKICRELSIINFGKMEKEQRLFLNIHPQTVNDTQFAKGETRKFLKDRFLSATNIVFEITERQGIHDFSQFNKTLSHYRNQGYRIAVDDAGAGFSSLQAIAEVKPEYIKIDSSLVRNIHSNRVKQALLETFVTFAQKIGCYIIAEGIETDQELTTLRTLGVHYGQGYYLARPSFPKPEVRAEALAKILSLASRNPTGVWQKAFPIGDISEPAVQVNAHTPVRQLKKILDANQLISGVVITQGERPVGLIMRHHLDRYLGTQYGVALYFERPVSTIMDPDPLVVDISVPIEHASQQSMSRDKLKLYDDIVITRDTSLYGVVSVQTLLDTMTKIRMEVAKGANPLTGLPGNLTIEGELNNRLTENSPFVCIYMDLDHFKSYNDRYGFENGDRLLLLAARLLTSVVRKFGSATDFIGHIGGDDFVILTHKDKADNLCQQYIRYFDRLVKSLYSAEDRVIGGFYGRDRQGQETWFPFVSVSLAIVECASHCSAEGLAETAAQLKKYAKSKIGSVYVRDRRCTAPPYPPSY
ncbi:EAL domain-containing protein [Desulforamulus ruminis]|uniref:Diguanylate cyclase n=1 Tax=Desulforamulus ruminis (strain ATCC 23193 / DSM 2154 / NCIMB 8452 / DL) TaxID=696281 RepID=F6DUH6_DESRL|nr:EAL domain-containing protein [Desulforamulus ruminis]AEG59043.1 diguanylate cyclase [Desulforamulus ruminis DSM 2154]